MLFYRVKSSSDGKPYLVRRRGGIEYWSAIVAGELFTSTEVAKRGLSLDDLEAVYVNLRKTHFAGPYRLPNDDASITPAQSTKDIKSLSHAVEEQVAKVATARPIYMPGTKPNRKRGELKVVRS